MGAHRCSLGVTFPSEGVIRCGRNWSPEEELIAMLQLDVGSTAIATSFGKGTIDPLAMSSVSSAYSHISSCVAG